MAKTEIGIDLGKETIKIVIIGEENGIFNIKSKKSYVVDTEMAYFEFVRNSIKDFTKENKISNANISFTIPQNEDLYVTRFFNLPNINNKEIEKGIKMELEEKTPLEDMNSVYYKYGVTDQNEEEVNILSVLIDKTIIQKLKKLNNLRWNIKNIEPQIITLGRITEGNDIIIDMGHTSTRIYVYKDGKPFRNYTVHTGGKQLSKRIETRYFSNDTSSDKRRHEKSRVIKHNTCFLTPEAKNIFEGDLEASEVIKEDLMQIASEIKRIVRVIEHREIGVDSKIDNIYITGGEITYFKEYLSNDLGYEVKELDMLDDKIYNMAALSTLYKKGYIKSFNYANIRTVKINYNNILVGLITASVLINVGLMDIHKKYDNITTSIQEELDYQQQMISEMGSEIQLNNQKIYSYDSIKNTIDGINSARKWFSDILYVLPEQTPLGIAITKLEINEGLVIMEGLSEDYTKIGFLAIGLEKYGTVDIQDITNEVQKEIYTNNTGIKDKTYKMTKSFKIVLQHNGSLIEKDIMPLVDNINESHEEFNGEQNIYNEEYTEGTIEP